MKLLSPILIALFVLFAGGCRDREVTSEASAEVDAWLTEFENGLPERVPNEHHADTLFTEHGVFIVSTQGGAVDERGRVSLSGESRTEGYFIAPRMVWVDTIQDAKAVMLEDMKTGGGLPLAAYMKDAESQK